MKLLQLIVQLSSLVGMVSFVMHDPRFLGFGFSLLRQGFFSFADDSDFLDAAALSPARNGWCASMVIDHRTALYPPRSISGTNIG